MRLVSYKTGDRASYGAVVDGGIIDLGRRLPQYATLLDVFRAQAIEEARKAATGTPDHALADVEMLPPLPAPEKNICVGINYPDRTAEYKDKREQPKYPNLFCRFPTSLAGHDRPIVRPERLRHAVAAHADLRVRHQPERRRAGEIPRRFDRHAAVARRRLTQFTEEGAAHAHLRLRLHALRRL